jgi:Fe2+ or Zn2+ uptake regulation protein
MSIGELTLVKGLGGGEMRYDTNTHDRHHLFCTRCHTLVDVDQDLADGVLPAAVAAGYRILRRQVTYYGIYSSCQALMEAESSVPVQR